MQKSRGECTGRSAIRVAALVAAALAGLPAAPVAPAAAAANYTPFRAPLIAVDWQSPLVLPLPFRNHCRFDALGNYYCANHCGADYQFYYCSEASFGCCRPGSGYCDWNGHLRCAP